MLFKRNKETEIIVKTVMGLESILAEELKQLGAHKVEILNRAVKAVADQKTVYRINLCSYFALRVLIPIRYDIIHNEDHLYNSVKRINWSSLIGTDQTIAVSAAVQSKYFNNSHYVALKTKDAIVDQFRSKFGKRPSIDLDEPDLSINIHIFKNKLTISLDSSGDSLHKRGYRTSSVQAPINEVLAAGLVKLSGWDGESTLWDPMCGSGTILAEAILQALKLPPQERNRSFGFIGWKDFDQETWDAVIRESMERQVVNNTLKVIGTDLNPKAVRAAEYNLAEAGLSKYVEISKMDFHDIEGPFSNYHLIMNPPYDIRLEEEDIIASYKRIGDTLKQNFTDTQAWIISGNIKALKHVGLRASRKINLMNGPIESKFHKFEMYAGSKKQKYKK